MDGAESSEPGHLTISPRVLFCKNTDMSGVGSGDWLWFLWTLSPSSCLQLPAHPPGLCPPPAPGPVPAQTTGVGNEEQPSLRLLNCAAGSLPWCSVAPAPPCRVPPEPPLHPGSFWLTPSVPFSAQAAPSNCSPLVPDTQRGLSSLIYVVGKKSEIPVLTGGRPRRPGRAAPHGSLVESAVAKPPISLHVSVTSSRVPEKPSQTLSSERADSFCGFGTISHTLCV